MHKKIKVLFSYEIERIDFKGLICCKQISYMQISHNILEIVSIRKKSLVVFVHMLVCKFKLHFTSKSTKI